MPSPGRRESAPIERRFILLLSELFSVEKKHERGRRAAAKFCANDRVTWHRCPLWWGASFEVVGYSNPVKIDNEHFVHFEKAGHQHRAPGATRCGLKSPMSYFFRPATTTLVAGHGNGLPASSVSNTEPS